MADILVRAVSRGYYRWLRNAGEEFLIPESLFTPVTQEGGWMEKVVEGEPIAPATDRPSALGAHPNETLSPGAAEPSTNVPSPEDTGSATQEPASEPPQADTPPEHFGKEFRGPPHE